MKQIARLYFTAHSKQQGCVRVSGRQATYLASICKDNEIARLYIILDSVHAVYAKLFSTPRKE
jgi:hypothetical protein